VEEGLQIFKKKGKTLSKTGSQGGGGFNFAKEGVYREKNGEKTSEEKEISKRARE